MLQACVRYPHVRFPIVRVSLQFVCAAEPGRRCADVKRFQTVSEGSRSCANRSGAKTDGKMREKGLFLCYRGDFICPELSHANHPRCNTRFAAHCSVPRRRRAVAFDIGGGSHPPRPGPRTGTFPPLKGGFLTMELCLNISSSLQFDMTVKGVALYYWLNYPESLRMQQPCAD